MATHDYILANASGAAFRTDLNNALAAIVSNNSNSSSPATTYAYQWWADTTANILKIRNSSNNAWINLFTLAGGIDVDSASNFNEDVTFTGASANIVFDKSDNALEFADNAKATFGTSADFQIFHDSNNSLIKEAGTGNIIIEVTDGTIEFKKGGDEVLAAFIPDGKVQLYHDNGLKMETDANGINMVAKQITFQGQSARNIRFRDGENDMIFEFDAGDFYRQNIGSSQHEFFTGNSQRLTIDSDGDVLIGTTSNTDNGTLAVNQDASGGNVGISSVTGNNDTRFHLLFRNGNGQVGSISTNGSATAFNESSDYRLKENVVLISDGITRLKTLKPSRFNFKVDKDTTLDGFIAHEVTAVPEAITGTKDETQDILYTEEDTIPSGKKVGDVKETVPKYQGIDKSKLVPLLVAAVQELIEKVEALEAA